MKSVFKYQLNRDGVTELVLPKYSWIVKSAIQDDQICLWIVVDTTINEISVRKFSVYGTGWDITFDSLDHIDTILDGSYVWHVFEIFD